MSSDEDLFGKAREATPGTNTEGLPFASCSVGILWLALDEPGRQALDRLVRDKREPDSQKAAILSRIAEMKRTRHIARQAVGSHRRGECACRGLETTGER